jgi:hypothetical protein
MVPEGAVDLELALGGFAGQSVRVQVTLSFEGATLADLTFHQAVARARTRINLHRQANGQAYESLLWSPENPRLVEASVTVDSGAARDTVTSYLGMRSIGWADGHLLLNDRPYYVRGVLDQGYWPDSHLAAPSSEAVRQRVELIKALGFNSVRMHEKVEDPRFLYWCDRLGLLVWSETPSAYEFSSEAVRRTTREWMEVIERDRSHPCIVIWVPLNESWGVQHIAHDPAQQHYAQALFHLIKAMDPSRLVISNDGWEHTESDLWTIHDYATTGADLTAYYESQAVVDQMLSGIGPLGRRMRLLEGSPARPVLVSEFGGVSYAPTQDTAWGYVTVDSAEAFRTRLAELFGAIQASPVLAGFCYTQLTDTLQEANGLTDPAGEPKLPTEVIHAIVTGRDIDLSRQRRPKKPIEQPHL